MSEQHIKVPLGSVVRDMTMTIDITGTRTWPLRLWLSTRLIRLAARIMGCNIKVNVGTDGRT